MTRKKVPSDLLLVIGLVLLTNIFVLTPKLNETAIRGILCIPLVLFLPGYSLIVVLFPEKSGLKGIERAALSFGLSIAVVPLIGLSLNYSPWGIKLLPILVSLSVFIFIMCWIAHLIRAKLPETEAFNVNFRETAVSFKAKIKSSPASKIDKILFVVLVLLILLSIATLFYVIITPKEDECFTEFYILGPNGKANNYTTKYVLGESGTVVVGIANHEYRHVNYTLELKLENKSLPLPEKQKHINLDSNGIWKEPITFTPPFQGHNMKLEFLLFNETSESKPYQDLHLWIDVLKKGEHFTEFYVLGPDGKKDNYTAKCALGESETVIVGIANHEYKRVNYTLELKLENKSLPLPEKQKHINLDSNGIWEEPITFTPSFQGHNMKLEFLLFNETSESKPYQDLHLWMDVNKTKTIKAKKD
jgi:uncharacterized membrane protein